MPPRARFIEPRIGRETMTRMLIGREPRVAFLLLAPAVLVYVFFLAYPFVNGLLLSLYRYNLMTREPRFIGFQNYAYLFAGPEFIETWLTTVVFVCSATALTTFLGLTWALILTQKFVGRRVLRTASLIPWVLPNTVAAFLASWLLNGNFGLLNAVLLEMGVISLPHAWLTTDGGAMAAIVVTKTWLSVPVAMIFFLAALQNIPHEQLEAAKLDGASDWQLIRHVIAPFIRSTIIIVLLLQAIGNLQHADVILALTGGGPVRATTVLAVEVYRKAFQSVDYGMAATTGVIWFLTIAGPAIVYVRKMFKE